MTRPASFIVVLLSVVSGFGCQGSPPRPLNPVLEDAQANLHVVESRLNEKPAPSSADYFEIGMARHQVWNIYLGRSRYPADTDNKTAADRRQAERLEPKMIEAFRRAADSADPHLAAKAKMRLSSVYDRKQDWDQQVVLLWQILRDHGGLNDPQVFGTGRTPHYYCYYTMGKAFKAKGARGAAIDSLARALLAIDVAETAGADFGDTRRHVLDQLVEYEPRIVLPRYQRLLPARIDGLPGTTNFSNRTGPAPALARMFEEYRENAQVRISLTVDYVDHNGALIGYEVVFPDYPKIIDEWQKEQLEPHPRLPDNFSRWKPTFRLSFATLPACESFEVPANVHDYTTRVLGSASATALLVFDQNGRCTGKIILKWSNKAPRPMNLYLAARLVRQWRAWVPAVPLGQTMEPVKVTMPMMVP